MLAFVLFFPVFAFQVDRPLTHDLADFRVMDSVRAASIDEKVILSFVSSNGSRPRMQNWVYDFERNEAEPIQDGRIRPFITYVGTMPDRFVLFYVAGGRPIAYLTDTRGRFAGQLRIDDFEGWQPEYRIRNLTSWQNGRYLMTCDSFQIPDLMYAVSLDLDAQRVIELQVTAYDDPYRHFYESNGMDLYHVVQELGSIDRLSSRDFAKMATIKKGREAIPRSNRGAFKVIKNFSPSSPFRPMLHHGVVVDGLVQIYGRQLFDRFGEELDPAQPKVWALNGQDGCERGDQLLLAAYNGFRLVLDLPTGTMELEAPTRADTILADAVIQNGQWLPWGLGTGWLAQRQP